MPIAFRLLMKLAMAMNPIIGEEETQRQREYRTWREREERIKSRAQLRRQIAGCVSKTCIFLFGVAVILYFAINSDRFQGYTNQFSQKLSAQVNAHSTLKKSALKYEEEVDQVTK